jgi:hypothetical protein
VPNLIADMNKGHLAFKMNVDSEGHPEGTLASAAEARRR